MTMGIDKQREREELIELAHDAVKKISSQQSAIEAIIDAILAEGYRKP